MTPEQVLAKCEAAFAADEPQVIPAGVARARCEVMKLGIQFAEIGGDKSSFHRGVTDFTAACKEIEA